jgi:hypothetical protein
MAQIGARGSPADAAGGQEKSLQNNARASLLLLVLGVSGRTVGYTPVVLQAHKMMSCKAAWDFLVFELVLKTQCMSFGSLVRLSGVTKETHRFFFGPNTEEEKSLVMDSVYKNVVGSDGAQSGAREAPNLRWYFAFEPAKNAKDLRKMQWYHRLEAESVCRECACALVGDKWAIVPYRPGLPAKNLYLNKYMKYKLCNDCLKSGYRQMVNKCQLMRIQTLCRQDDQDHDQKEDKQDLSNQSEVHQQDVCKLLGRQGVMAYRPSKAMAYTLYNARATKRVLLDHFDNDPVKRARFDAGIVINK